MEGKSLVLLKSKIKSISTQCNFCGRPFESSLFKIKVSKKGEEYIVTKCPNCHKNNGYMGLKLSIENNILYTSKYPPTTEGKKKLQEVSNRIWWIEYQHRHEKEEQNKNITSTDAVKAFCNIIRDNRAHPRIAEDLYKMAQKDLEKVSEIISSELLKEEDRSNVRSLLMQITLMDLIIGLIIRNNNRDKYNPILHSLIYKITNFSDHDNPKITRLIAKIFGEYYTSDIMGINQELNLEMQRILISYLGVSDTDTKKQAINKLDIDRFDESYVNKYIDFMPRLLSDRNDEIRWEITQQIVKELNKLKSLESFPSEQILRGIKENTQSENILLASLSQQALIKLNK